MYIKYIMKENKTGNKDKYWKEEDPLRRKSTFGLQETWKLNKN